MICEGKRRCEFVVESIVDKRPALTVRRKNLERFVAAEVVRQPSASLIGLTVYG